MRLLTPAVCLVLVALWSPGALLRAQGVAALAGTEPPADGVWLEALGVASFEQDWSTAKAGHSVDGHPLTLKGRTFAHGIGTHATSVATVDLHKAVARFVAVVGVDDETAGKGSVVFSVVVDGRVATKTAALRSGGEPVLINVDLVGAATLELLVDDAGDGIDHDHADWAGAALIVIPGATPPPAFRAADAGPELPIAPFSNALGIHGPRSVGTTPGRPFLFRVPVSAPGPFVVAAKDLPAGLTLDAATGVIAGTVAAAGMFAVTLTATSGDATVSAPLMIVAGAHKLARTPPLGWNSWNVWATAVDEAKVRAAGDAFIATGLAAHGFSYINIDDAWEGKRDAAGRLQTNERFPDMKRLADDLHRRGLKLGIYSSPGPKTCAGYEGSWKHEVDDATSYAAWSVDYLKYDWCSYGDLAPKPTPEDLRKPYRVMRAALDGVNRDIVYSLCQYGMGDVWTWGHEVGGNCWRTTGDIVDTWNSMANIGFAQDRMSEHAGPGHWNDPDMLVVGRVGWGPQLHPSRLTHNEQITHITLWSLLAAPLLIGCDLSAIDPFTLALLTNDEVLAVDQDVLGAAARRVWSEGSVEVWKRPLDDGSVAIGFFNRGRNTAQIKISPTTLGLTGPQLVRDLWTRTDQPDVLAAVEMTLPRHGARLWRVRPAGGR